MSKNALGYEDDMTEDERMALELQNLLMGTYSSGTERVAIDKKQQLLIEPALRSVGILNHSRILFSLPPSDSLLRKGIKQVQSPYMLVSSSLLLSCSPLSSLPPFLLTLSFLSLPLLSLTLFSLLPPLFSLTLSFLSSIPVSLLPPVKQFVRKEAAETGLNQEAEVLELLAHFFEQDNMVVSCLKCHFSATMTICIMH